MLVAFADCDHSYEVSIPYRVDIYQVLLNQYGWKNIVVRGFCEYGSVDLNNYGHTLLAVDQVVFQLHHWLNYGIFTKTVRNPSLIGSLLVDGLSLQ